jgi:hypothetical protein
MRKFLGHLLSGSLLERRGTELTLLLVLAAVLDVAAGVGLAYVAGFSQIRAALGRFDWPWLVAVVGGLVISFAGYYYAYRGIFLVDGGPEVSRGQMRAVVVAGFGGFLAHGGGKLDQYALEAAGTDAGDAKVRVSSLAGLEHGVLSIIGCVAAIVVLAAGRSAPPGDVSIPWAVLPVPGFVIAFWLAERYRGRFASTPGWRRGVATFLESVHKIRQLFAHPLRWGSAIAGMALFWLLDAFAAWSGLAAFGVRMDAAAFFLGFGTGMVFTRRTGPLAGAGVLTLVLPVTIMYSGAPLAAAVVGIFTYRVIALWLPVPVSLAALPRLRDMGEHRVPHAEGVAQSPHEPGLRRSRQR